MSLVGTRPPTLDEWEKYELHHYAKKNGLKIISPCNYLRIADNVIYTFHQVEQMLNGYHPFRFGTG